MPAFMATNTFIRLQFHDKRKRAIRIVHADRSFACNISFFPTILLGEQ